MGLLNGLKKVGKVVAKPVTLPVQGVKNAHRLYRIYREADALLTLFDEATESYNKEGIVSKSLFASKTFWVNVLTGVAQLTGMLPIPAEYTAIALAVVNVVLRMLTAQPVTVLAQVAEDINKGSK